MNCYLCGQNGARSWWGIGILDGKIYYHEHCAARIKCKFCEEPLPSGTLIKQLGGDTYSGNIMPGSIVHLNCTSARCGICKLTIGTEIQRKSNDGLLYHDSCAFDSDCSYCQTPIKLGYFKSSPGSGIRHFSPCSSTVCNLCSKIIGVYGSAFTIDGLEFHGDCLYQSDCYACKKNHGGARIADGPERALRHIACSIERCPDCQEYLGDEPIRRIDGKDYHRHEDANRGLCGPICECCQIINYDEDALTLKPYSNEKYRHTTCNGEPCAVCDLPLGLSNTIEEFHPRDLTCRLVHDQCLLTCRSCGIYSPIMSKIKLDPVLTTENKKLMPKSIKQSWMALWVILRRQRVMITDYGQEKVIPLPPDIRSLILETFIQDQSHRL